MAIICIFMYKIEIDIIYIFYLYNNNITKDNLCVCAWVIRTKATILCSYNGGGQL